MKKRLHEIKIELPLSGTCHGKRQTKAAASSSNQYKIITSLPTVFIFAPSVFLCYFTF